MKILLIFVAAIATTTLANHIPGHSEVTEGTVVVSGNTGDPTGSETEGTTTTAVPETSDGGGVSVTDNAVTIETTTIDWTDMKKLMEHEAYIVETTKLAITTFSLGVVADRAKDYELALKLYLQGMGFLWSADWAISHSARTKEEAENLIALLAEKCIMYKIRADKILKYLKELHMQATTEQVPAGRAIGRAIGRGMGGVEVEVGDKATTSAASTSTDGPEQPQPMPHRHFVFMATIWKKILHMFESLK